MRFEPRQSYIAFARWVHFALLVPATASRLDLGLRLPGAAAGGRLAAAGSFGTGSVTHRLALTGLQYVDAELLGWLRAAYQAAG